MMYTKPFLEPCFEFLFTFCCWFARTTKTGLGYFNITKNIHNITILLILIINYYYYINIVMILMMINDESCNNFAANKKKLQKMTT